MRDVPATRTRTKFTRMSVIKAGHVSTGRDEIISSFGKSHSVPTFQRDEFLSFWHKEKP